MLALQIDDENIEKSLNAQFDTAEKIKEYIYNLIAQDIEDKNLAVLISNEHKKDYVTKGDIFKVLDNI